MRPEPRQPRLLQRTTTTRLVALLAAVGGSALASPPDPGLQATLEALDTAVFDSFNACAQPQQLARHAAHFDPAVEFYHDSGGVTWDRAAMLANTAAHACGKYTRQRVEGSLQVHPVPGFGAITQGRHRFCSTNGTRCEGLAWFTMVWRQNADGWKITRVLSYGHQADAAP